MKYFTTITTMVIIFSIIGASPVSGKSKYKQFKQRIIIDKSTIGC